jgi:hypothetical protein
MLDALAHTQYQVEFGSEEDGDQAYWACPAVGKYLEASDFRDVCADTRGATLLGAGLEGEVTSPAVPRAAEAGPVLATRFSHVSRRLCTLSYSGHPA